MDKVLDMRNLLAAAEGDTEHVLGKFLYFSLANLLVDKEELSELCDSMGITFSSGNRLSVADAFRSATGDIRERVPVTEDGETNIYLAYCRDNKRTAEILSRELVKETMNRQTNQYEKLANIIYDKGDGVVRCDNMVQWMCGNAAAGLKNCSSFISAAPTANRSRPFALISCAGSRPPS